MVDRTGILSSIKKLLNVDLEDTAFDNDIILLINGEFMTLYQLGIGPKGGFSIDGYDKDWSDFTDNEQLIDTVKTYVYMRVRMIFDPPASSVVADQFNARIQELQWRLNVQAEQDEAEKEQGGDEG